MTVAEVPASEKPFDQLTEPELVDLIANDWPWYARNLIQIVSSSGQPMKFEPRPGQLKLWDALKRQRDAGKPMRARILKARKVGFSTLAQSLLLQRATNRPNHHSYTVAHDRKTGGELFAMIDFMYGRLPNNPLVKPPIANQRRKHELVFGEPSRMARRQGRRGIDSWIQVDTANESQGGRGFTIHSMHLSEVAFYGDAATKLRGLMQAVPNEPDTLILQESTANGYNHWRKLWYNDDDFEKVFVAWHEEPSYRSEFATPEDREEFVSSIGMDQDYGQYEAEVYETFDLEPEQLAWWRWNLRNSAEGDLRAMQQENPSTPEEAFLATGRKVFDPIRVGRMIREVEAADREAPPEEGVLRASGTKTYRTKNGVIEVPTGAVWVPRSEAKLDQGEPVWRVWEHPQKRTDDQQEGRYVIGTDVASEEENENTKLAYSAIEIVNHRTDWQVAEIRAKAVDAYELAELNLLAALYWHRPWVAIEVTGGWGGPAARILFRDFHYPFTYFHKSLERGKEKHMDRIGWDSNKVSKRFLIEDTRKDLRDWTHGVRSVDLAREHSTLVLDRRGMAAPDSDSHSDLFMAYRIAKRVAQEKPVRSDRPAGFVVSTATRAIKSRRMGY